MPHFRGFHPWLLGYMFVWHRRAAHFMVNRKQGEPDRKGTRGKRALLTRTHPCDLLCPARRSLH